MAKNDHVNGMKSDMDRALYSIVLLVGILAVTACIPLAIYGFNQSFPNYQVKDSIREVKESLLVRKISRLGQSMVGDKGKSDGDNWMYGNTPLDEKYIYAVEATNLLAEIETLTFDVNSPSVQRWLLHCKYLQEELKAGDEDDARLLSLMEVAERSVTGKGDYFSLKELDDYFSIYGFEYKYYSLNELEQGIRKYVNQRRSQ